MAGLARRAKHVALPPTLYIGVVSALNPVFAVTFSFASLLANRGLGQIGGFWASGRRNRRLRAVSASMLMSRPISLPCRPDLITKGHALPNQNLAACIFSQVFPSVVAMNFRPSFR